MLVMEEQLCMYHPVQHPFISVSCTIILSNLIHLPCVDFTFKRSTKTTHLTSCHFILYSRGIGSQGGAL